MRRATLLVIVILALTLTIHAARGAGDYTLLITPAQPIVGENVTITLNGTSSINATTTLLEVETPSARLRMLDTDGLVFFPAIFTPSEPGLHRFQLIDRVLRSILIETVVDIVPRAGEEQEALPPTEEHPAPVNGTNGTEDAPQEPSPPAETNGTVPANETQALNETNMTLSIEEMAVHERIIVGQDILWRTTLDAETYGDAEIEIPQRAANVRFLGSIESLRAQRTGRMRVRDLAGSGAELRIEYTTPGPAMDEIRLRRGKHVTITSDEHYEDVLAHTTLDESLGITDPTSVRIRWIEDGTYIVPDAVLDTDRDGIYDRIEWTVPHLSTQTFDIIVIDKADHLDSSKGFLADIYDEVREQDGLWSEQVADGEYVRARFERRLFVNNDIRVYARVLSGSPRIDIYEAGGDTIIATLDPLADGSYSATLLPGLSAPQDAFDLHVVGGNIEIDHIIDPSFQYVNVQRGVQTLASTSNTTAIDLTDTSRAFVLLTTQSSGSGPNDLTVTPSFSNASVIQFDKYGTGTTSVSWEIVESPIFNVQRSQQAFGTTDTNAPISISAVNTSRSFIIVYDALNTGTGNQFVRGLWRGKFVNSTAIDLSRGTTGTAGILAWQVVELSGGEVRSGTATLSAASTSIDAPVNRTFNLSRSTVILAQDISGATGLAHYSVQGNFTNTTNVQFRRNTASGTVTIDWFAIEHPFFNVQHGSTTVSGGTAVDQSIASVNLSRTFHTDSWDSTGTGTVNANRFLTSALTSATNLQFQKGTGSQTQVVYWDIVTINIDDTVPGITINSPAATYYGPGSFPLLVNITISENGTNAHYSLDDWSTNTTLSTVNNRDYNASIATLADGSYTLRLLTNDTWGNTNDTLTLNFSVDSVGPNITIREPQPQVYPDSENLLLNVTIDDPGVGSLGSCLWNIDGAANQSITCNATTLFNTSDGLHTITFYANDTLGNMNWSSVDFTVNSGAPAIVLDTPADSAFSNERTVNFSYTPTYGGNIDTCILYGNWTGLWAANDTDAAIEENVSNSFPVDLSIHGDSDYLWNVWCNSTGGGSAFAFTNYTFRIDATSPQLAFDSMAEANDTSIEQDWIAANVTLVEENLANITFTLSNSSGIVNETTYDNATLEINWTGLASANMAYTYAVVVMDLAGNMNATETRTLTLIDTSPPIVALIAPQNTTYESNLSIPLGPSVTEANLDTCWYSLDDGANTSIINCAETTIDVLEGGHSITVYANDTLGQLGSASVVFSANNSFLETVNYSVQRGTTTVNGVTYAEIAKVDRTKSFLKFNWNSAASGPDAILVMGRMYNNTHLQFSNYGGGNADVSWEIITGEDISTKRNVYAYTSSETAINVTIGNVNLSDSFILVNSRLNTSTTSEYNAGMWTGRFINATLITFERDTAGFEGELAWQVVSWENAQVQNGNASVSGTLTQIDTSEVNLSSSFLEFSRRDNGGTGLAYWHIQSAFDNASVVNFSRTSSTGTSTIEWFVISHPFLIVERSNTSVPSSAAVDESIGPVDDTKTFHEASWTTTGTGQTNANSHLTSTIVGTNILRFQKGTNSQTQEVAWEVVSINKYDLIAPEVSISAPAASSWQNFDFAATYTIDEENPDTCLLSVRNGTGASYMTVGSVTCGAGQSAIVTVGSSGDCTVEGIDECGVMIWANDTGGRSDSQELNVSIDRTAPAVGPQYLNVTGPVGASTSLCFNVSGVTDVISGLSSISGTVMWPNGSILSVPLNDTATCAGSASDGWYGLEIDSGTDYGTLYYNRTDATDIAGNAGSNASAISLVVTDITAPTVTALSPIPDGGTHIETTFAYQVDDYSEVNCTLFVNGSANGSIQTNVTTSSSASFVRNLSVGSYNWTVSCTDTYSNVANSSARTLHVFSASLFNGNTTNLSGTDMTAVENFTLERLGYGNITFTETLDLSGGRDLDSAINITDNFISLDADAVPLLNSSANITLTGLSFQTTPNVLRDGAICATGCTGASYSSGTFTFGVSHFTNYSAGNNSQIGIWDEGDPEGGSIDIFVDAQTRFFANYTNISDGTPALGATCNISFNDPPNGPFTMVYNATIGVYEHNRTFSSAGAHEWNVTCLSADFEPLTVADNLTVVGYGSIDVTLLTPQVGSITDVYQNRTFTVRANVSCVGNFVTCGNISANSLYNITPAFVPATYVNGTEAAVGSETNTLTISAPIGIDQGDLLIAIVGVSEFEDAGVALVTPTGWTYVASEIAASAVSDPNVTVFYHYANDSEPASYVWNTGGTTTGIVGHILAYRNVGNFSGDPFGQFATIDFGTSQGCPIAQSVTTARANETVIYIGFTDDDEVPATEANFYPTGTTGRQATEMTFGGDGMGLGTAQELRSDAGATGNRSFQNCNANDQRAAITFSLDPSLSSIDRIIVPTSVSMPFHTSSTQPQYCSLGNGEWCTITWIVNATGNEGTRWSISVNATSEYSSVTAGESGNATVNITADTIPPIILDAGLNATVINQSEHVKLNVTITDGTSIMANATIRYPNGALENITFLLVSGNEYAVDIVSTNTTGMYNITEIRATDAAENINVTTYSTLVFTATESPPAPFSLLSPANNTISTSLQPTFVWDQSNDTHFENYTVFIDSASDFVIPDYTYELLNTFANVTLSIPDALIGDITYYWRVIAFDVFGNSRTSSQDFVYVTDVTNPSINLNAPGDGSYALTSAVRFNATAIDTNLANCTLYTNSTGSWAANQTNTTVQNGGYATYDVTLADGAYLWNVMCIDNATNAAFVATNGTFSVDTTPPNVSLEYPVNATFNDTANNIIFSYNVTDISVGIASCSLVINGSIDQTNFVITEGVTQNFTAFVPNGNHTWSVNCTDDNGIIGASETYNIEVSSPDSDPPVIILNSPFAGQAVPTADIAFNFTASDASGLLHCSLYTDGTLNQTNATPLNVSSPSYLQTNGFTEMIHNWSVECFDNRTSIGANSTTKNFTVDLTDPIVLLHSPQAATYVSASPTFNYTGSDTNLANCSLYGNWSGTWQAEQDNISVVSGQPGTFTEFGIADGIYLWNVVCADLAGRTGTNSTNRTILVDTTPPWYEDESASPSSPTEYGLNYSFNITWHDDFVVSSVVFEHNLTGSLANETVSDTSGGVYGFNTSGQIPGVYQYKWYATDANNNTNQTDTIIYTVTGATPIINLTINGTNANASTTEPAAYNLTAFLTYPPTGYIELYVDGELVGNGTDRNESIVEIASAGLHNVTAVYNATQNYSQGQSSYFINASDPNPPIVTLVSPANNTYQNTSFLVTSVFNVTDIDSAITSCDLVIDDSVVDTSSSISEDVNQSFTYSLANGQHNWSVNCISSFGSVGSSLTYNITINSSSTGATLPMPDAAAPGMNVVVQFVGSNFISTDEVTTNSSDIVVGPSIITNESGDVVAANGVLLTTTFFISQTADPQDVLVSIHGEEMQYPFRIVQPRSQSGNFTGASGIVTIGDGNNGTRTFGGAIVLDSLVVPSGVILTVDTTDPDADSSNGNQGYFPAIVLVDGIVNIAGIIDINGSNGGTPTGDVGADGGTGGPGGGGGGGGGGDNGNGGDGGDGFTGGGAGSCDNDGSRLEGNSGAGTGAQSTAGGPCTDNIRAPTGGGSQSGAATGGTGGEGTTLDGAGGAGGTGFFFGTGGTGGDEGVSPDGGLGGEGGGGGGSASNSANTDNDGGGGGLGTAGTAGAGGAGGQHANSHIVPLAGGSGGGGGGTESAGTGGGDGSAGGGGGGGAILIFAQGNLAISGSILGGGGNGPAGVGNGGEGGGGSGGAIILQSQNITVSGTLNTNGGTGSGGGGEGGLGRVRIDGNTSTSSGVAGSNFTGPAIVRINATQVVGQGTTSATIQVNIRDSQGNSRDFAGTVNSSGGYAVAVTLYNDTNYITVIQNTSANAVMVTGSAALTIYDNLKPNVTLVSPANNTYLDTSQVNFTYNVSDVNLANCTLYTNSTGSWAANQTNTSPVNNAFNNLSATFANGVYLWNVVCTDTNGNRGFATDNRTVYVDTTPPNITFNAPVYDANVSNPITFNWTARDNLAPTLTCSLYIDGTLNESGISIVNGNTTTRVLDLSTEGTTTWNVTCVDLTNNYNSTASQFFNLISPPYLDAMASGQNVDLNWTAVSGAGSYSIYIGTNYSAGRPPTANVTGIGTTSYTDSSASDNQQRYYWISAVRGTAEAVKSSAVGKYSTALEQDLNLVSFPLNPWNGRLENGTGGGFSFATSPACVVSLWRRNNSAYQRTDWNGTQFVPAGGSEIFTSISVNESYWLETNGSCTITYAGAVPTTNDSRRLGGGFNLLGWNSVRNTTLPTDSAPALFVTTPSNSIQAIDRFNAVTQVFEVTIHYLISGVPWGWFPSFNNQDFLAMDPTRGYSFDSVGNATWVFDPGATT